MWCIVNLQTLTVLLCIMFAPERCLLSSRSVAQASCLSKNGASQLVSALTLLIGRTHLRTGNRPARANCATARSCLASYPYLSRPARAMPFCRSGTLPRGSHALLYLSPSSLHRVGHIRILCRRDPQVGAVPLPCFNHRQDRVVTPKALSRRRVELCTSRDSF